MEKLLNNNKYKMKSNMIEFVRYEKVVQVDIIIK